MAVRFQRLAREPLDAASYVAAGKEAFSATPRRPLAHALFRTARCLGASVPELPEMITASASALPPLINMDSNTYFRNRILADEVARLGGGGNPVAVLDVGGGMGTLARFLDARDEYFLAEPSVNGIAGESVPLADRSMDFAVSCHVLEHIMPERRAAFLDSMARIARKAFIVLVPVEIGGADRVEERLRFFIEVTDAKWAKEHLACSHPAPDFFRDYAASRGYRLAVRPAGDSCAASALALMQHYASLADRKQELVKIHRFFNRHYRATMSNAAESDQYVFTFTPR